MGLYTNPDVITPSVCQLREQLTQPSPFFEDRTLVTRDDLLSYARLFGLATEGRSNEELADEIKARAPCHWIERVYDWAEQDQRAAHALNQYVTDTMMLILAKIREGRPLDVQETNLLREVDRAVQRSPRPDEGFTVYRGSYNSPGTVGQIITFDTPKSGSFHLEDVLQGYVQVDDQTGEICCLIEIYVPSGSVVSYHPSEDQVIFPTGAQFHILSGPQLKMYQAFGESQPTVTYQAIYIGNQ